MEHPPFAGKCSMDFVIHSSSTHIPDRPGNHHHQHHPAMWASISSTGVRVSNRLHDASMFFVKNVQRKDQCTSQGYLQLFHGRIRGGFRKSSTKSSGFSLRHPEEHGGLETKKNRLGLVCFGGWVSKEIRRRMDLTDWRHFWNIIWDHPKCKLMRQRHIRNWKFNPTRDILNSPRQFLFLRRFSPVKLAGNPWSSMVFGTANLMAHIS